MTNARQRIANLLTDMGISCNGNGYSSAEIDGYCAGISIIENEINKILGYIFINLDGNDDLSFYKGFINQADTRDEIIDRFGESWGLYSKSAFYNAWEKIGAGKMRISDDAIVFSEIPKQNLGRLGKFAFQYIPPFVNAKYNGSGISFDKWNAWGKSWIELDKMALPFNIIDSLRGDEI